MEEKIKGNEMFEYVKDLYGNVWITSYKNKEGGTKKVIIPEGIFGISRKAFIDSRHLEKVIFPKSLTRINADAFLNCHRLKEIKFPYDSKLEKIGKFAFAFTQIEKVKLPNSIKVIGNRSFFNYSSLEILNIPDDLVYLPKDRFLNSYNIKEIHISKNNLLKILMRSKGFEYRYIQDLFKKKKNIKIFTHQKGEKIIFGKGELYNA